MIDLIKQLLPLLTKKQRKHFLVLQLLVILMASSEVIAIASIGPFMAVVAEPNLLQSSSFFSFFYNFSGANNTSEFINIAGISVLIFLAISSLLSMFTVWKLSIFASKTGTEISDQLYKYYMNQNWLFFANGSSAELIKKVSAESVRVSDGIIQPLVQLNARAVLATFISIGLLLYNPILAILGLIFFIVAYIVLYKVVRGKLSRNGAEISKVATLRFRLMNEGFGGIKDLLILNRKDSFVKKFQATGNRFANARGGNLALSMVPRYFMELLAFGIIIILILYLIKTENGNLGTILPIISIYALAAFKLLPALQQIYASLAQIKGNIAAFESIRNDLKHSQQFLLEKVTPQDSKGFLSFERRLELKGLTFTYPGKKFKTLNELNLVIPANHVIGIVGSSGSGKSTIIDLILGLIHPQNGSISVDDVVLNKSNLQLWQAKIGFVPQSIFLSEGTISENVAFGVSSEDIDSERVLESIKLSHLDDVVNKLPLGVNTKVGERGVQLSGGQRQRLGIARALYNDASVLVFDEATSALDGLTEKLIMESINEFQGKKTIIMIAHRLKTVKHCDTIFFIEDGQVNDQGSYDELIKKNESFKRMAEHA